MQLISSVQEMQQAASMGRRDGRRVALVPTMGFLHEGHLSLVRLARARADRVVLSLFVNPTQFGPGEDLSRYPRDSARDRALCEAEGVDVLFAPDPAAMYAPDHSVYVVEERLGQGLCGASRPGHFRGVCTVVTKLFNLCRPDLAVFGEKDAQQLRIIRRMVRDLNQPVEIVSGPIVRESDGVAMSSRNVLLSAEDRRQAVCLQQALVLAERGCAAGERDVAALRDAVVAHVGTAPSAVIDYAEFVDDETLEPVQRIERPVLLALAVKFAKTRLIDNTVLRAG